MSSLLLCFNFSMVLSTFNLEDEGANGTDSSTKVDERISAIAEELDVFGRMSMIEETEVDEKL